MKYDITYNTYIGIEGGKTKIAIHKNQEKGIKVIREAAGKIQDIFIKYRFNRY